jgi:hypothetical protein
MMTLETTIKTIEIRQIKVDYAITYPVLKSFSNELKQDIKDDMWSYDPEHQDEDTLDTDVHDTMVSFNKIIKPWGDNIIE